ncbi:hypothetical protein CHARACLAT_031916 [Characodon lateralis]|uniref:Uncharacterized protein n=1 Tax=Characodon lateralis TaxID=208331 RepID=A0ABU7E577_9TELE|nr:hypothetical protein [Characodon lateralis]
MKLKTPADVNSSCCHGDRPSTQKLYRGRVRHILEGIKTDPTEKQNLLWTSFKGVSPGSSSFSRDGMQRLPGVLEH